MGWPWGMQPWKRGWDFINEVRLRCLQRLPIDVRPRKLAPGHPGVHHCCGQPRGKTVSQRGWLAERPSNFAEPRVCTVQVAFSLGAHLAPLGRIWRRPAILIERRYRSVQMSVKVPPLEQCKAKRQLSRKNDMNIHDHPLIFLAGLEGVLLAELDPKAEALDGQLCERFFSLV